MSEQSTSYAATEAVLEHLKITADGSVYIDGKLAKNVTGIKLSLSAEHENRATIEFSPRTLDFEGDCQIARARCIQAGAPSAGGTPVNPPAPMRLAPPAPPPPPPGLGHPETMHEHWFSRAITWLFRGER